MVRLSFALLTILFASLPALAQSGSRVSGQVLDASQAAVPGAKVTAENVGTGIKRDAVTDDQGRYGFPDMPVGAYRITAEAKGFQRQARTGIDLRVATSTTVDFTLAPGQISDIVEVSAVGAAVEPTAANGTYLGNKQLTDLPINGRDYGRFALLTPGAVARSNFIADMGFNGMHTVANNFSIDGVDASRVDQPYMANGFERGSRLLTGSIDTIEEFRVQTSNYNAEFGRSAGSSVTVVSKSGTNQFRASLFEFLRNDFFDARNFFNTKPQRMAPFRYNNFGGNLGGPLVKDKTFFFANYEGSRQRVGITGSGTVPSRALRNQILATSPALAPIVNLYPLGTSPNANPNLENYVTQAGSQVREDTGSIKVDHNFSANDRAYIRFNLNDSEVFGPLFGVTPSALGVLDFQQVPITTTNVAVHESHSFSPKFTAEFLVGLQRWGSQINSDLPFPQVAVNGFTVTPGSRRFSRTNSTLMQWGGSASMVMGAHTMKFGATVWRSGINSLSTNLTTLTYTSIDDFIRNSPAQAVVSAGNPGSGIRQTWAGMFVQDTWQIRPGLTLDYGMRYDIGTPNHGVDDRYRPFDIRAGILAPAGSAWFETNRKNVAPRVAIAWTPMKKLVIRTGYGIFYQQYPPGFTAGVVTNLLTGNTTLLRANIPNLAFPTAQFLNSGTAPLPNVGGFNPNKPDLYAQQWNFTMTYQVKPSTSLQAAYVGNHAINLRRGRNVNFLDPAIGRRPFAGFADIQVEFNDAMSVYHGLQLRMDSRMGKNLLGTFNYSYAKVIDNVQDYGLYSTQPQDNRCLGPCERGLGSGDIRQNVTYNVLYQLPVGPGQKFFNTSSGVTSKILGGWSVSSLALIRSGIASLVSLGTNTFGNNNFANQRPDAVLGVNPYPTNQSITNFWNPAAFSLPARGTFGNLGRNVLFGPDFWQFDSSLTKDTQLTERTKLTFRAEVFNLFNRPNFEVPQQGTFGTANFGRIFNTFGRTLGFGTSRQIQLSMRLRF